MEHIRILIADDHKFVREGIRDYLNSKQEFEVVGEATNGAEAVMRAADLKPDVLLMDIAMEFLNGIEATRRVLETNPDIAIVVITMYEAEELVFAAMRAGARGYILKSTGDYEEVVKVIHAVANGEAHFGPAIAKRLLEFFSNSMADSPQAIPQLSKREFRVLDLIAQGRNRSDIVEQGFLGNSQALSDDVSHVVDKLHDAERAKGQDERYLNILQGRWNQLSERMNRLEQALDIETDPSRTISYEQQLRSVKARREEVGQDMKIVEERIQA